MSPEMGRRYPTARLTRIQRPDTGVLVMRSSRLRFPKYFSYGFVSIFRGNPLFILFNHLSDFSGILITVGFWCLSRLALTFVRNNYNNIY